MAWRGLAALLSVISVAMISVVGAETRHDEGEMWTPRPDAAACQRVRTPEEAASVFGISPFTEDHVTRIAMASGDVIWSFFVPAASLPSSMHRAARVAWPRDFLLFEARLTEQACLESSRGVFSDLALLGG